jgi:hypothetical protein
MRWVWRALVVFAALALGSFIRRGVKDADHMTRYW